jgi:hypothetical protein
MINIFSSPITVIRETKSGSYVRGIWTPGKASEFEIQATVEPLDGQDLLLIPEGERTKEMIRIYSELELKTADEACARKADVVRYQGKLYEVHKVKTWTQLIPHFETIAISKSDLKEKD